MTTISSKNLSIGSDNSSTFALTFPGNIHLKREAIGFLKNSSNAFKSGDEASGRSYFVSVHDRGASEYADLTYFFLYVIHGRPEGDPNYGCHAFFNECGRCSSLSDRSEAIDLTLSLVSQYEHSLLCQGASLLKAEAYEGSLEQWWDKNKDTVAVVGAVGGAILAVGAILTGRQAPTDRLSGVLPGHVVVGGGHMDAPLQRLSTMFGQAQNHFQPIDINPHKFRPGHIVVGGGHMDSIQQKLATQLADFMNYAKETNNSSKYQIVLCKKKDKQNNDNNNNNNSNESQQNNGHISGGFNAQRDSNGNYYIEGNVDGEVRINDNTSVGVSGSGWVDQNGNYGGGGSVNYTINF